MEKGVFGKEIDLSKNQKKKILPMGYTEICFKERGKMKNKIFKFRCLS
ncbi:MAG: hypothetical protein CM15mP115_08920 [Alphaproteobacteria bacterium]|nr:MAG: hypothetical protein CM15mP115_08920 [Alphaproteobacteria bacterium]